MLWVLVSLCVVYACVLRRYILLFILESIFLSGNARGRGFLAPGRDDTLPRLPASRSVGVFFFSPAFLCMWGWFFLCLFLEKRDEAVDKCNWGPMQ